ncbi:LCP family protein [Aestuariimicrobium ganziense]|uniref:LCP family protein n=1 Tax=Aestuariimicrobium ganziense TaxID=2773677 RepID=UPI001941743F|nr:LCP family protein [Aestuariimicrobium ganziense]
MPRPSSPTPTALASLPPDPLPKGVVNVLFFGTDARDGSLRGNADVILVAQVSSDRRSLTLVSIARDTYAAYAGGGRGKINAAFVRGGTEGLRRTVSSLLGGLPIHLTAQTNFVGMNALAKLLEPVTVVNRHRTTVQLSSDYPPQTFEKGTITLRGPQLLLFARERKSMPLGDLDRAERHRAMMIGMLKALQQRLEKNPVAAARLLREARRRVKVTGPVDLDQLTGLVPAIRSARADRVTSLMVPIARFGTVGGASVNLVDQTRLDALSAALKAGDVSGYVTRYGTSHAPTRR